MTARNATSRRERAEGRPTFAVERAAEAAGEAATAASPWRVTTADGDRVTVLGDAGAGDWHLACPNCGTYLGCIRLARRDAIRGFEVPCRGCTGLLLAETTAVWPRQAGRDVARATLREAVRWGAFDAAPPAQTNRIDPNDPDRAARRVILDGPNQRWAWFHRPEAVVTAEPACLSTATPGVSVE